jgi:hypothetical protein
MNLLIDFNESLEIIGNIPHKSCGKAMKKNWNLDSSSKIKAQSICWLFCWAKTGMGKKDAKTESIKAFDKIFGESSFIFFDSHVDHKWAKWARYRYENNSISSQLNNLLNDSLQEDIEIVFSKSQGFQINQKIKKNIEKLSMKMARIFFEKQGYNVIDHSKKHPYDFYCSKDKDVLFVEVKGTQTLGEQIILTRNEVQFAKKNKDNMVLYVLSQVKTNKDESATGGIENIIMPWKIIDDNLCVISYNYVLKQKKHN